MAIHRRGSKPPLFWVQAALVQTPVLQQLDREQPIYCLYRLKSDHAAGPPTFADIAAYHIETMRSLQPQGPYALAGYCICATIAYEMARQLREQGETVSSLIMIDPVDPAISRGQLVRESSLFNAGMLFNRILFALQKISASSDKVAYIKRSLQAIRMRLANERMAEQECSEGSECAAPARRETPVDVHDSDMYAFINCVPKPYAGAATIVRPAISPAKAYEYPNRRWKQLIGGLDVRRVPGDSDNMWLTSNAQGMSAVIGSCLPQAPSQPAAAGAARVTAG